MTAVPPRPAAPSRYYRPCCASWGDHASTCPAAPDATAGDGLREVLRQRLAEASKLPWGLVGGTHDREIIDDHGCHVATTGIFPDAALIVAAVNALPALRDVLAAAARDAEKVRRVTAIADELLTSKPIVLRAIAARIRRALDPS